MNLGTVDRRAFNGVTTSVVYLDVSNNHLVNIDFLLHDDWAVLSHLTISYNHELRTLPTGIFGNTPALRYLESQDIGLTQIDKNMFIGLSKLHTLDLAYNQITNISTGAFQNSPYLVELRLYDQQTLNQLMNFQSDSFLGIESSLELLNLMGNKFNLSQFWEDLVSLANLKELDLTSTGIEIIPDNAFRGNTQLNTLILSDNKITYLTQETFYGPRNTLQTINIQRNRIQTIGKCVLNDFTTKPKMILFGNPLVCDCDLVWLYDWFKTQSNQVYLSRDIGSCVSPPSFSNKYLDEFTRDDLCSDNKIADASCSALYTTETSSTTTAAITTNIITTTELPLPSFELVIVNVFQDRFEITWMIQDKTYLTELKIELKSHFDTKIIYLGLDQTSYTFYMLTPDTYYTVCLILKVNNEFRDSEPSCKLVKTLQYGAIKPSSNTTVLVPPDPGSVLG